MQTGIISFGDRVAWNIKCNNIKDIILNELLNLYNVRIIQKHYFQNWTEAMIIVFVCITL